MNKCKEVIKDWEEHSSYPGRIVFNIQIDKADFNEMIKEIKSVQKDNKYLQESEDYLIKIREDLSDIEFQPSTLDYAVAKPEGIYDMTMELKVEYLRLKRYFNEYTNTLNETRRKRDEVKGKLEVALKDIKQLKNINKELEGCLGRHIENDKQQEKEIKELKDQLSLLCPIGDLPVIDTLKIEKQMYMEHVKELEDILREIDTHIRSDNHPVPYITETLQRVLPEYNK